jgi:hypothetical protein
MGDFRSFVPEDGIKAHWGLGVAVMQHEWVKSQDK